MGAGSGARPGDFGIASELRKPHADLSQPREPWREVRDGRHVVLCGGEVKDGFCQRCWMDLRPPAKPPSWLRRTWRAIRPSA